MNVKVTSHRREVVDAMERGKEAALEAIGAKCAGYALMLAPVDTGRLKNSITWATRQTEGRMYQYSDESGNGYTDHVGTGVPDDAVCIGTNVEYAFYQEMGTSKTPAQPFLTPAVENHMDEYKAIAKASLSNVK